MRAQSCGIDMSFPLHSGDSPADNITACQLFYQDACLHGLVTPIAPTSAQVNACLYAIQKGDCNAVVNPQNNSACAWLNPPDAGMEAGVDASTDSTTVDVVVVPVDSAVPPDTGADSGIQSCINACYSTCVGDLACQDSCEAECLQG